MRLLNWTPTKSILERRISGNLKHYPSLKNVRDEYERVQSQTGNSIMDRPMKYVNLWKNMEPESSEEKY